MRSPALFSLYFVAVGLCLLGLTGCGSLRKRAEPPAAMITGPGGASISQTGDAATPATADTSAGSSSFTIPAGTPVSIAPDGTASFTAAEPIRLSAKFETFRAAGPGAFTPPAPPTPTEEAAGRASLFMRLGLVLGIAAGAFGLVRGWDWVAYGGGAIAAGCVAGLALASIPPWLWVVFGVGAAACVIGPVIWHTKLKPRPNPFTAAPV